MRKVWIDRTLRPLADATVSTLSHSVQRGTTVFDVLSVVYPLDHPLGALVGLSEHVGRFFASMAALGMDPAFTQADIELAAAQTVAANPGSTTVKLIATWNESPLGTVPVSLTPTITISALDATDYDGPVQSANPAPLKLGVSPGPKVPSDIIPPSVKVGATYTASIRHKLAARAQGFDDVIMRTAAGDLAEATSQTIFVVTSGSIAVPTTDVILDGITRRSIIELANYHGIALERRTVPWDEVLGADEVFASATTRPIWPVGCVGETAYQAPGEVTLGLIGVYDEMLAGRHPLSDHWLSPVASVLDLSGRD